VVPGERVGVSDHQVSQDLGLAVRKLPLCLVHVGFLTAQGREFMDL